MNADDRELDGGKWLFGRFHGRGASGDCGHDSLTYAHYGTIDFPYRGVYFLDRGSEFPIGRVLLKQAMK
ncbi:hypothetical protein B5G50_21880 [Brevibacillus brevis]|nr:hypothetical protein B5G50_21880 [Brevibacillus brevis]